MFDAFPLDASGDSGADGDGIGDNADTDDDNDHILTMKAPYDASEHANFDGDNQR